MHKDPGPAQTRVAMRSYYKSWSLCNMDTCTKGLVDVLGATGG